MNSKITTRFAPSPTGFLHVGGLRTALYNYLFAKKNNGKFILRIEDTDQERLVEGAADQLEVMLQNFGLQWDNEEIIFQSKRLDVYHSYTETLIKEGKAYRCFCSKERLDDLRKDQQAKKLAPKYDRHCCNLSEQEISSNIEAGKTHVVRFKMPSTGNTQINDLVRGEVTFANNILDDQIILKSDGFPTYHLASVIDDHESDVTHVIRGEEWLPSTPKHVLLYEALGWEAPQFAHLPLLLNADRSKLSKRQGDVAAEDYLKKGYLPDALLNFVLLLGWNPGSDKEVFSSEEMLSQFSLEKVNKAGAVFNVEKLDWLNSEYIKKLSSEELARAAKPYFDEANISTSIEELEKIVVTEQTRIKRLDELVEKTPYFFSTPEYDVKELVWKKSNPDDTKNYLTELIKEFSNVKDKNWNTEELESHIKNWITAHGWGMGDVLWPARFAMSGLKASPSPFEIANALGKKETIKRLETALSLLEK